ncbi:hypothetical protein FB567DRAFT_540795 [Paraphoma chrysanthemicola]|uniref:Uncharacterized protein n=1 Tax=Paraphoma chrysanthemicola TaxID=798071 RepID=A0A8K0QTP0_9PLEO|nr:hypothetical protein FB567DRAFT_540795 [Paraphoma chrysanthemicola]
MEASYDQLVWKSMGKSRSSQWYMERLGLPIKDEHKNFKGIPRFIDGCDEIEKLYRATLEEVNKMVSDYSTIEDLRAAVSLPTNGMVKAHVDVIYRKYASVIWSAGTGPMTQPSVRIGTSYHRPLVFNNAEDRQRIQYLLLGWIVHRAHRKLQKKIHTEATLSKSKTMLPNVRATSSRGRNDEDPDYRTSFVSDGGRERGSVSGGCPYIPTEGSSDDGAASVSEEFLRRQYSMTNQGKDYESRLLGNDHASVALQTLPSNKHGSSTTKPSEEQRAIKRRDMSMPDVMSSQKRPFGRTSNDSTDEDECSALLQDFKARKQTIIGNHHQSHLQGIPNLQRDGTYNTDTFDDVRLGETRSIRITQRSPFELHATPPSPIELPDERGADLVASQEGGEQYTETSELDTSSDHWTADALEPLAHKGKSVTSHSREEMEVERRLLAIKLNDMLQDGYQQLTSHAFKHVETLLRTRWEADAEDLEETFGDAFEAYYMILDNWLKCVDGFVTYNDRTGFFGDKQSRAEHLANQPDEIKRPARRILLETGLMTAQWRCDPDFTVKAFSRDLARVILNISHWSNAMAPGELEEILSDFNARLLDWFN